MSDDRMRIRQEDLIHNPSNRVPIVLCLDVSGSMGTIESGEYQDLGHTTIMDGQTSGPVPGGRSRIAELNEGLKLFVEAVKQDPVACASVEMCIVTFSDQAAVEQDFQTLGNAVPGDIAAGGGSTNLGAGVNLALDLLEARKREYKRVGIDYFQPWLVLMTDGQPTTDDHVAAGKRARNLEEAGKLVVFPVAIGKGAELATLRIFSGKNQPLRLKGLNFRNFFQWLSKSVSRVSQSRPGEKIGLDLNGIKGWAEISG